MDDNWRCEHCGHDNSAINDKHNISDFIKKVLMLIGILALWHYAGCGKILGIEEPIIEDTAP